MPLPQDPESLRLRADKERLHNWKRWGPYLAERQWGTVREDYSEDGNCWDHFTHDHARSRAYRWGEDGLLGLADRQCRICICVGLWNGRDRFLKERLYGLTNHEGNHSEDVKEEYYYLRSTPTHSYMKALYKYPQRRFPYTDLTHENRRRGRDMPEYELVDTGVFDQRAYFDVAVEYAKADAEDILIRYTVKNHGRLAATLHLLPQIWFRNVWAWSADHLTQPKDAVKPKLGQDNEFSLWLERETLGRYHFHADPGDDRFQNFLFTDNDTNYEIFGTKNEHVHTKDAFHSHVVDGDPTKLYETPQGTKAAAHYILHLKPGETTQLRFRFHKVEGTEMADPFADFDEVIGRRVAECDLHYDTIMPGGMSKDDREICLQAYAGLMWTKQFYYYPVENWLPGDPNRRFNAEIIGRRRNHDWKHLFARDVISMPDKWEYPWFAAWDLAFHTIPLARVDPVFAKRQLTLLLREWYMHPNGQIPAYEFAFGDVNPPVHAWASWRVYQIDARQTGVKDRAFLAGVFQKLLLNFTWWVNRKDERGQGVFSGGFLGLDNIGIFDRGAPLPTGGSLQQADATAWMAFYCVQMLRMAVELAYDGQVHPAYQDMASKFLTHFVQIVEAVHTHGGTGLWNEVDGFYYDHILPTVGAPIPLKSRSLVGLLPLIAVKVLEDAHLQNLPEFRERFEWYRKHSPLMNKHIVSRTLPDGSKQWLFALASRERLLKVLRYMLDEKEFLSEHGIRSLSRYHLENPFTMTVESETYEVRYDPGDSTTNMFGGNSNWRGPIWFPINHLLIEALEGYYGFFGDSLQVEYPTGSGTSKTLQEVANDLKDRHASLFRADEKGRRPCHGTDERYSSDEGWKDLVLFYEYFHGDTGRGHGASHQTGWTALVSRHIEDLARTSNAQ